MTQAEIDKLTDELIDTREELTGLRAQYEDLLQKSFVLALDYNDVADALGLGYGRSHHDILARAKELASFARVA